MTDQDDLSSILDRILAGDRTEVDIEKLRQSLRVDGDVVQLVSQDGKFNTNIGKIEGGTFHIGDVHQGADSETIERIILKALQDTLQLQSQKPLTYLTGSDGLGALSDVPELPVKFLPRPNDLEPLKALLIDSSSQTNTVTGKTHKVGIQGMGGIGKSVLAAALAREEAVRRQFSNGIVWIRLGYDRVNPIDEQIKIARALTNEPQSFVSIQEGKVFLENLLRDTACLLILDDVWHLDQIEAFNVLGVHCQMVITTRDTGIIATLGAEPHQLDVLSNDQALQLLAQASEQEIETLPAAVQTVAEECGNLPLALAMIGTMAKGDPTIWFDLLELLQSADLVEIEAEFRDKYPYPNLLRAMKVSVDGLKPEEQECYFDFAVFPQDTPIPIGVLQTFWQPKGLNKIKQKKIIDSLVNRSLLRRDDAGRLTLHDLQLDYVRQQVKDLPVLHDRLLNAYQAQCPQGWHTYSPDGYFFEWFPYHLKQAARTADLQALLLNYSWLQAKLDNTSVHFLITDYDLLPDSPCLSLVQRAIKLSSHIIRQNSQQLPGQLAGRLLSQTNPEIQRLLKSVKQVKTFFWLRPISANLTSPEGPLLFTLKGHQSFIEILALTPDGKRIVSGSGDHTVKIWDLEQGQLLHSLEEHQETVTTLAIDSNSKRCISGSSDGTLKVWNLEQGQLLHSLKGHSSLITSIALTSDNKVAVSASWGRKLKVWDLQKGSLLCTLKDHDSWVYVVVLTPNDKRVISGSDDGELKVWDLKKGKLIYTLDAHFDRINAIVLTPDGKRAISASGEDDRTLKVWNLEQKELLYILEGHRDAVRHIVITSDGKRVVSGSDDETLKVWDLEKGKLAYSLEGHNGTIRALALTPDNKRVISGSGDWTLKVWDLEQGRLLNSLTGHQGSIESVVLTPDGKRIVSGSQDKTLKVWDLEQEQLLQSLPQHQSWVKTITAAPDGQRVVSGSGDWTLKVWGVEQGELLSTLKGHQGAVLSVVLTSDGQRMVSASEDRTLKVWDLEQGQLLHSLKGHERSVNAAVITSDDMYVVSVSGSFPSCDNSLKVWDLEQGLLLHSLDGHQDIVNTVVLTPDGKQAISASEDQTLKVWDLEQGQLLRSLEGHQGAVNTVVLTPDGKHAISGSDDWTLKMWDVEQGQLLYSLEGHQSLIVSVALTLDGKRAVSASWDCTLKVWDLEQAKLIGSFAGDGIYLCCTFIGDTIIAGDGLGKVHFLQLEGWQDG